MSIKEYKKQFIELMIKLEEEHGPVKEISLVADRRDFNYWPS